LYPLVASLAVEVLQRKLVGFLGGLFDLLSGLLDLLLGGREIRIELVYGFLD
jgi:hypothetical protein